ncbi:hypothetical protein AB03_2691 [Escherichia coli 2-316-03_S1_C1]|nr:hypothetical protein AB03_2691 [Escherichia coli 2-316-03_S1_C1]
MKSIVLIFSILLTFNVMASKATISPPTSKNCRAESGDSGLTKTVFICLRW